MPVKEHERVVNSKFTSKLEELSLKLKQAEGDRDTQMEEVYRVKRLMREEKEQKEETAYRYDKERRAREAIEGQLSEKKE
jgi:predicted GIY-YIG superfamily endonuclease